MLEIIAILGLGWVVNDYSLLTVNLINIFTILTEQDFD